MIFTYSRHCVCVLRLVLPYVERAERFDWEEPRDRDESKKNMDWVTDHLKRAEEMLQAVDQTVAASMKEGVSLPFGLPGAERVTEPAAMAEEPVAASPVEPLESTNIPNKPAPAARRASSTSKTIGLIKKKKLLEERRQELKEKKEMEKKEKEQAVEAQPRKTVGMEGEKGQEGEELQPNSATIADDSDRLLRLVEALRKRNKALDKEVLHLEDELTEMEKKNKEYEDKFEKLQNEVDRAAFLEDRLREASTSLESSEETVRYLSEALERAERESATLNAERNVSETHLLASLRSDVDAAELVAENERRANALSRKTFEARETQLEEAVVRATAALAESQTALDECAAKLAESQSHRTALEAQLLEARKVSASAAVGGTTGRGPCTIGGAGGVGGEADIAAARVRELEVELRGALKDAASAKNELSALEVDVTRLRDENAAHKQRILYLEASDATRLQRRVNELTSVLYAKQSEIENLSAEKNALVLQSQSEGVRRRSTAAVDKLFAGGDGNDADNVVPMRSLRAVDKLAGWKAAEQWVEKVARLLDAIALQAVVLIRSQPLFRLGFFAYIMGMHMFVYVVMYWGTSTHSQVRALATSSQADAGGGGAVRTDR